MNRSMLVSMAVLVAALCPPTLALPREQIPADAKWLVYIDAQPLRNNPVAEALRKCHADDEAARDKQDRVRRAMGLASWDDLESIVFYGTTYDRGEGVLLFNARTDHEAVANSLADKPNYETAEVAGRVVHSWTYDMKRHGQPSQHTVRLALLPDRAVMTRDQAIEPALAVLEGKRPNLNSAEALLAPEVPTGSSIYVEAAGPADGEMPEARMQWLRNVKHMRVALVHAENEMSLQVDVTVRNAETAVNFKQVIEGFRAMALLRHQAQEQQPLRKAIEAARIEVQGDVVTLRWAMPNDQIVSLIERHGHRPHHRDGDKH